MESELNEILKKYMPNDDVSLDTLVDVEISDVCFESYPCQHYLTFYFEKDDSGNIVNYNIRPEKLFKGTEILKFLKYLDKSDEHFSHLEFSFLENKKRRNKF